MEYMRAAKQTESTTNTILVTRNGVGDCWRFASVAEALAHPICQESTDVVLTSSDDIPNNYGMLWLDDLLAIVPSSMRENAHSAWNRWREKGEAAARRDVHEFSEKLWDHLVRNSPTPPTDPARIVGIITGNRNDLRNNIRVRATGSREEEPVVVKTRRKSKMTTENSAAEAATEADVAEKTPRKRSPSFPNNGIVTVLAESNPKRAGSAAHERFEKYQSGRTVAENKQAGIGPNDLKYDSEHGYIRVSSPEGAAAAA